MMREDYLGDKSKLYLTLYGVDCLHLENCKIGLKAGCFSRVRNKEQGREKEEISDGLGPHSQPCFG